MLDTDFQDYVRNWWSLVIRGVAAVILGLLVINWPGTTIVVLVIFFGAYAFIDGIFAIAGVLTGRDESERKWLTLVEGGAGILVGLITFFWPGLTVASLILLIAAWALVTGVVEIVASVQHRKEIEHAWVMGLTGALSVIFGVILLVFPVGAVVTLAIVLGVYAIVAGIMMIVLGIRLRRHGESSASDDSGTSTLAPA